MAAVSAASSGKPPSTVTLPMVKKSFEALAGAVRPSGLVTTIAPDGPDGGANVVGVTRDGATTCPLAPLVAVRSAKASAPRVIRGFRRGHPQNTRVGDFGIRVKCLSRSRPETCTSQIA